MSDQDQAVPTTRTTTLKDNGPNLPIGVPDKEGRIARAIDMRPWRGREEREIGKLRSKMKDGAQMAEWVSTLIAYLYKRIGPWDLEPFTVEERRARISQMYLGDVFYCYVWARCQALGDIMFTRFKCNNPTCQHYHSEFPASLHTLEVEVASDDHEKLPWVYDVETPFKMRGAMADKLVIGPTRWSALEQAKLGRNLGEATIHTIAGSVHGVGDQTGIAISPDELDDMTKRDLDLLSKAIDKRHLGPIMKIDHKCDECGTSLVVPFDWNYDSFFSTSSG